MTSTRRPSSSGHDVYPSRRQFLKCSLLAGGLGVSMADVLRLRAESGGGSRKSETAVIQIWLGGGPSQFETFDPKPDAPLEIRGPYKSIKTKLPGVLFSETMARTAAAIDKTAIVRTVTHSVNGHGVATNWLSTGYRGGSGTPSNPSVGSIVSRVRGPNHNGLPPYVLTSHDQTRNFSLGAAMGPAYLGAAHAPFTLKQDPFEDAYDAKRVGRATASFELANDLTLDRFRDRRTLLGDLDRFARDVEYSASMKGIDRFHRSALEMLTTGEARRAFDVSLESEATRRMYGPHRWGQMALLARRLVEAGVTFVTVNTAPDSLCWDWHLNIVNDKRPADGSKGPSRGMDISGPPLDQMVSALVTDLYQRGLDKKVLLLVWGEFGRTPRINNSGGRDHWGSLMSILFSGGGLNVGQVIGASKPHGDVPRSRPVGPTDVLATVYRHLGIDPALHTLDNGRPIPILPDAQPIREL